MPRLSSFSSKSLIGLGLAAPVVTPPEQAVTTFVGRMIGLGTEYNSTVSTLVPTYALGSNTTWTAATTTPSSFLGDNASNWAYEAHAVSTGTTVLLINGYSGHTATTTDGVTWTSQTRLSPNTNASLFWCGLAYTQGSWVTVWGGTTNTNGTQAAYSTNAGSTWTYVTIPGGKWAQVVGGNGLFIAIDAYSPSSTICSADGGATWSAGGTCPLGLPTVKFKNSFFYAGGTINKFVCIREYDTNLIGISTTEDGITWTAVQTVTVPGISIFQTPLSAYGNGRIVMIQPYSNNSWYSTDAGATWTRVVDPFTTNYLAFSNLYFYNGVFIATARTQYGNTGTTYISSNGALWTRGNSSTGINTGGGLSFLNG